MSSYLKASKYLPSISVLTSLWTGNKLSASQRQDWTRSERPWSTLFSYLYCSFKVRYLSPGASQVAPVVKNPPANVGDVRDVGSIPGWRRPHGEGNGNPLRCSCLENPMDRGAWSASVPGVAQSWTRLERLSTQDVSLPPAMKPIWLPHPGFELVSCHLQTKAFLD